MDLTSILQPPPELLRAAAFREPTGPTRRRFLQGAAIAAGTTALLPSWLAKAAGAATPLAPTEGVVVVVTLSGGNDALNTLVPVAGTVRSRYEELRGDLALAPSSLLPVSPELGLHPSLSKLAARFGQGAVALVQGVGSDVVELSHFSSMATLMAGTSGTARDTGWLGRYVDGLTDHASGLRSVAIGNTVPLHLAATRAKVTAVPAGGGLYGADSSASFERSAQACLRAFAASSTGLGVWADTAAMATRDAVDRAADLEPLFAAALPAPPLVRDLTLAARVINAGLGARCVTTELGGWDSHAMQAGNHAALLAQLDDAIEAFFGALSSSMRPQVTLLVISEFGRRAARNGSFGTDHGNAGMAMVVGDNVRGGLYGQLPSLTSLDAAGSLVPTVDFRSLYASVLGPWLGADAAQVLGRAYEDLGLFRAGPGQVPAP